MLHRAGGVARDRDALVPGSASQGDRGMYQVSLNINDLLVNEGELSSIASTEHTLLLRSWRHEIDALSVARRSGSFGWLDAVALLASNLLRQFGGDVAQLTSTIGTQLF